MTERRLAWAVFAIGVVFVGTGTIEGAISGCALAWAAAITGQRSLDPQ